MCISIYIYIYAPTLSLLLYRRIDAETHVQRDPYLIEMESGPGNGEVGECAGGISCYLGFGISSIDWTGQHK